MPGKTSMDALILTCGTGGGHNTAALAVKEALESRGHRVDLLNLMSFSEAAPPLVSTTLTSALYSGLPGSSAALTSQGKHTGGCRFAPPSIRQTERLKK